jgi:phenylalanyl-tRNA synthetase beta chain
MKIPLNWLNEIVDLPKDKKSLYDSLTSVGHMLDKIEVKNGVTIMDLELRGNRADCYSILGIAREVSAIYKKPIKILEGVFKLKKTKTLKNSSLSVKTSLVKRAAMTEITNVKIEKSPKWLSDKLQTYGIESVNNIVDLTNYIMIETGEPMHAFDLDKVKGQLEIRLAKTGEKITTFQGTTITLTKEDLVWTKGKEVLSVAGAIGEKFHSISDNTKNILLEAANYDRANIRRSVYRHGLLTEAGIRHEKDLDPNMVIPAIERFLYFVKKYNWGEFNEELYDYYPAPVKPWNIAVDIEYIFKMSGLILKISEIQKILRSLGCEILKTTKKAILVQVPTFRTDVKLPEDIVEEIVRIYGYDKIPVKTLALEIPKNITPDYITQEDKLKTAATGAGFDEIISLSFVKVDFLEINKDTNEETSLVEIINPPSPDTKTLRITLLPNLYEQVQKAVYERADEVSLFEIGKVYGKWKNSYLEKRRAGFLFWKGKSEFKDFKSRILGIFENLNIDKPLFYPETNSTVLKNTYNLQVKDQIVGWGGEYKNMQYLELDLDSILDKDKKYHATLWPKYPPQIEDITFNLPKRTLLGHVSDEALKTSRDIIKFDLKEIYENSYTFNVWYQNPTHTLDNKEVELLRNKIIESVNHKFGAEVKV